MLVAARTQGSDLDRGSKFLRQADDGCVIESKASTILQFFQGLNGSLYVTFEEGTYRRA
jgi:hypothetical protein